MPRRIKIVLSYDGTAYSGWQIQPDATTIQGIVEHAVGEIEGKPVRVEASGRTDAGVHALAQVAAFDMDNPIPVDNLRRAMNRLLPLDIRIVSVEDVDAGFHPRFQSKAKTYEYRIWREEICPPFERLYHYHFPYPLDETAFCSAASLFKGEHDFTAFAAADEKDALGASKVREVYSCDARRDGPRLIVRVRGSGFLKHMVRLMMGTLIEAGKGNISAEDLNRMLLPGGRKAVRALPSRGLFLVSVEYQTDL